MTRYFSAGGTGRKDIREVVEGQYRVIYEITAR